MIRAKDVRYPQQIILIHFIHVCIHSGLLFFATLSKALNVSVKPCPVIAIFGVPTADGLYNKRHADIVAFASLLHDIVTLEILMSPS